MSKQSTRKEAIMDKCSRRKGKSDGDRPVRFLDLRDTARFIGRTPTAVYRLCERGKIPYRRQGKKYVFDIQELTAWFENSPGLTLEQIQNNE